MVAPVRCTDLKVGKVSPVRHRALSLLPLSERKNGGLPLQEFAVLLALWRRGDLNSRSRFKLACAHLADLFYSLNCYSCDFYCFGAVLSPYSIKIHAYKLKSIYVLCVITKIWTDYEKLLCSINLRVIC